jgi:hypothetical protein
LDAARAKCESSDGCMGTVSPLKLRGMFSKLRVALSRPTRPSLLLEKNVLNSTYASLDDLEMLKTIGT